MNAAHNWKNVAFIRGSQLPLVIYNIQTFMICLSKIRETLEPLNYIIFSNGSKLCAWINAALE